MKRIISKAACLIVLTVLGGCAQLSYYAQAMQGQMSLLSSARPIEEWLSDPKTSDELKVRLTRAKEIRAFAAHDLGLPNNGSYKTYADLKQPYVMWNVIATPELSMKPLQWCFPVAGCVDYRGYYRKDDAKRFADELKSQSKDVMVSGVPAYSTLGWFNDPVLSTFIKLPEAEVARMVFHELAHQVAYAPGDSAFNEAFATAVEEIGVARWINSHGDAPMRERYRLYQQRKQDFVDLLTRYRRKLIENFESNVSEHEKRERKASLFEALREEYEAMKAERWSGYAGYDRWFTEPMSNAHFALISTYQDLVPAFQALYQASGSLPAFYRQVRALAKMEKPKRRLALEATLAPKHQVISLQEKRTVAAQ